MSNPSDSDFLVTKIDMIEAAISGDFDGSTEYYLKPMSHDQLSRELGRFKDLIIMGPELDDYPQYEGHGYMEITGEDAAGGILFEIDGHLSDLSRLKRYLESEHGRLAPDEDEDEDDEGAFTISTDDIPVLSGMKKKMRNE